MVLSMHLIYTVFENLIKRMQLKKKYLDCPISLNAMPLKMAKRFCFCTGKSFYIVCTCIKAAMTMEFPQSVTVLTVSIMILNVMAVDCLR